jgi:chemotaxis protein CheC
MPGRSNTAAPRGEIRVMHQFVINPPKQVILDHVAIQSAENASTALTKWFGQVVRIHSDGFSTLPLDQASTVIDGGERAVVAVHMLMTGALTGHILLAFPDQAAAKLVSTLVGETIESARDFDDMAQSAICETGNIVSSAFTNSLTSHLGVRAVPSAPTYCYDMGAALIEPLIADQAAECANVLYIAATFEIAGQSIDWWLYVIPSPESMQAMVALLH